MKHRSVICRTFMVCLVSLVMSATQAQTADELLKQKQTKRKYALLEIAQWKLYASYLQKGIAIAGKGLTTIQQVKAGNWKLDEDFFDQLLYPAHAVKQLAELEKMKRYPRIILHEKQHIVNYMRNHSPQFSPQEISHISGVMKNLLTECMNSLETLVQLTQPGTLSMPDDERVKKIHEVKEEMKKQVTYTRIIVNDVKKL